MRDGAAISLAVVGVHHANADGSDRRFEVELCAPGEPVELRCEPKNPVDPRAVAVYSSRGVQLGYLTAERAVRIGPIVRSGREHAAAFQFSTPFGAWIRLALDGEVPAIPDQTKSGAHVDAESDFMDDGWYREAE